MVTFNFSYAPGTSLQQMIGFEMAGRIWSSYLTDNASINLHVGVSNDLPSNVIGGALPGIRASQSYGSVTAKLKLDITSADDQTAVKTLRGGNDFKAGFDLFNPLGINQGDDASSKTINLTRANAKAAGINLPDNATALDGYILFGSLAGSSVTWNYDYTRTSSAAANSLDFLTTAIHEIAHVLGFVSGVDKPGWLSSKTYSLIETLNYITSLDKRVANTTMLDLFRYSANDSNFNLYNNLSYGSWSGNKYFSIDGGKTAIAQFSTGSNQLLGGDGYQASHWKAQSNRLGIMAPTLSTGQRPSISALDLRALDAIGWNLSSGGISTNIDLSALQSQSKQSLASRLNQTVSWLDGNATIAAQNLAQNRDQDVYTMIQKSEIYDLSRTTPPSSTPTYKLVIEDLMREEALFETLDELTILSPDADSSQTSLVNTDALSHQLQNQASSNALQAVAVDFAQTTPGRSKDRGAGRLKDKHRPSRDATNRHRNTYQSHSNSFTPSDSATPLLTSIRHYDQSRFSSAVTNLESAASLLASADPDSNQKRFGSFKRDRSYDSYKPVHNLSDRHQSSFKEAQFDSLDLSELVNF